MAGARFRTQGRSENQEHSMKVPRSRGPRPRRTRLTKPGVRAGQTPRISPQAAALDRLGTDEIQRIKGQLWAGDADARLRAAAPGRRLVAEGDSWFDYPP